VKAIVQATALLDFAPMAYRLLRAKAHPPTDHAAQSVAQGGHSNGGPKQFGTEFDKAKYSGF
jgi:hypothetical protein